MASEELEIEIDSHGHVTVHTKGFKGKSCLKIAEELARILGREESRQLTGEYYEAEQTQSTQSHVDVRQRY
jgi:quercetin dioxygenase-like cupin family protein